MIEEKRHAADYTPVEVEAARRVMIEVAQNLGDYAEACVLVGGWVPDLLLSLGEADSTGSIDVDLALNPASLSGDRYASLLDMLKQRGYEPGDKPFQLRKEVEIEGRKIPVDVEFLAPKGAKMSKHRPKLVPGFRSSVTPSTPPLRIGPDEMARRLGIKRRTLTDWQRKRLIPFERVGPSRGRSVVLFDVDAVDKALKRWRVRSVAD